MIDPHTLSHQKCVPCEGGTKPLTPPEFAPYMEITSKWTVQHDDKEITREFTFKDFDQALIFVNNVGAIAQEEGHHPDIYLHNWNKVAITLSTHAIGGLSVNDFVVASKIDLIS
jgi:4a-hydroxytetrahydrobiopterin dehydratase